MTFGEYRRTKPRINVKRGFAGNEPQSITLSAPPRDGDGTIKSGMLITIEPASGKWIPSILPGSAAGLSVSGNAFGPDAVNTIPYFAFADDTDTDVKSSGLLLGLSSTGEFELQTGFFDNTQTYAIGTPLIKSATPGNLAKGASFLSAVEVVGIVSNGAKEDIVKIDTQATPDGGGHQYVINLYTRWKPSQS
jgi:hypothetical protein